MFAIDKEMILLQVQQDLKAEGHDISVEDIREILTQRAELISIYSRYQETIKYGTIGKFTIFKGRKEALENKRELIDQGYTPVEAGKILRAKLKETKEIRNNKTHIPKRVPNVSDIDDLPLI